MLYKHFVPFTSSHWLDHLEWSDQFNLQRLFLLSCRHTSVSLAVYFLSGHYFCKLGSLQAVLVSFLSPWQFTSHLGNLQAALVVFLPPWQPSLVSLVVFFLPWHYFLQAWQFTDRLGKFLTALPGKERKFFTKSAQTLTTEDFLWQRK